MKPILGFKKGGPIHSNLGGGFNGLLRLSMNTNLHLIMTGWAFNLPQYPGYLLVIPDGSTSATTREIVQYYKVHKTKFDITKSCDDALKKKILASFRNYYV